MLPRYSFLNREDPYQRVHMLGQVENYDVYVWIVRSRTPPVSAVALRWGRDSFFTAVRIIAADESEPDPPLYETAGNPAVWAAKPRTPPIPPDIAERVAAVVMCFLPPLLDELGQTTPVRGDP